MSKCQNKADYRYTWPGKDESFICNKHIGQLKAVAVALGLHLQTIRIDAPDNLECQQNVKETP